MFARLCVRSVLQTASQGTSGTPSFFSHSACRNTVVVERWWQVPLSKEGSPPRLYPRRHRVYRLVEDSKHNRQDKMELLLTQTVPKLGGRGDTVFVKKSIGRNKLLPTGLAVYPSPENRELFSEERRVLREGKLEDRIQTRTGQLTVEFLKRATLEIVIQPSVQFQLSKEIVCRNFLRKLGVVVPPDTLTLPDEAISQYGDYWCNVTVNGLDTVRVPICVTPVSSRKQKKTMEQEVEEEQDTP